MTKVPEILYEDKFVQLIKDKLVIKCYYFPIATNKQIPVTEIQCIYFKKQVDTIFMTKGWGMAVTVWWACDMKRQMPSLKTTFYNVALDSGSFLKQGFTVVDIVKFLRALRSITNAPVENRFPDAFERMDKILPITVAAEAVEEEVFEETKVEEKEENLDKNEMNLGIPEAPPSYDEAVETSKIILYYN